MTFWITDWLGTCAITELPEEGVAIIDVRDLVDGKNSPEKIKLKMEAIFGLASMGFRVVIRCVSGMSRSNAIACGVLCCLTDNNDWDENLKVVKEKCPRMQIVRELEDSVKEAVTLILKR